jgi:hypothetical protein
MFYNCGWTSDVICSYKYTVKQVCYTLEKIRISLALSQYIVYNYII